MKEKAKSKKKSRIRLLHQYYKYTGFYGFVGSSLKKAVLPIVLFIGALWAVDHFFLNIEDMLVHITETYQPAKVLAIFLLSESLLGLVPPELFIAWAGKSAAPFLFLTLLASMSYLGGVISYGIGLSVTKIPSVRLLMEVKLAKHIHNTRKWGGFLIIVGALLPIPFAITSIAAGIIRFPFSSYLIFALLRFARFYLYALVIFKMV
ncbi:MAG: VTT domain-containing protein [Bacteroidota bacterium]|uniref:VTT domain-containing protein n=1 Tax=Christiangramia sp. TaxID=1931228 RepID=UPI000C53BE98|nr:short-chain dehydrogenase [Christiangramia sp.]MEE2771835.1 VTT domain-containing protein [Bacteroidota bacterium]